jgi:hypothetical protein
VSAPAGGFPLSPWLITLSYLGGSLELVSLDGWGQLKAHRCPLFAYHRITGTDAYLRLPKLVSTLCVGHLRLPVSDEWQGRNLEGVEV